VSQETSPTLTDFNFFLVRICTTHPAIKGPFIHAPHSMSVSALSGEKQKLNINFFYPLHHYALNIRTKND